MRYAGGLIVWLIAAIIGLLVIVRPAQAEPSIIVVLSSHSAPHYRAMIDGFQAYLRKQGVEVRYEEFSLEDKEATQIMDRVKAQKASLVYSLGSRATQAALRHIHDRPIVAGLVLSGKELEQTDNATGVILDYPLETQLQWLKRFVPSYTTVGVLYNPAENRQKIAAAKAAAKELGLELLAAEVNSPKELPAALESLLRRVDVLWSVPDRVVFSPKTAKAVLLSSFRNRIPFIGLSSAWVKAGALYALDWDYRDLGAQSGEMALNILRGEKVGAIAPSVPRTVCYSLNLKTARHMKLAIPDALVDSAQHVFR